MQPTVLFRPRSASFYAVAFWVAAALLVLAFSLNGGFAEVVRYTPVALTLAATGWALFWRPAVGIATEGLLLINPFRTVEVPWGSISEVETRWGLAVRTTDGHRYLAAGAPAKGGFEHRHRDRFPEEALDRVRPGTVRLVGDADVVGRVVELRLDEHRTADGPAADGAGPVRVRPAFAPLAAVLGSASLAALLVVCPG